MGLSCCLQLVFLQVLHTLVQPFLFDTTILTPDWLLSSNQHSSCASNICTPHCCYCYVKVVVVVASTEHICVSGEEKVLQLVRSVIAMIAKTKSVRVHVTIYIYIYIYKYECHSINKVNIAQEVGNKKHCLQLHLFQRSLLLWVFSCPRKLSAWPSLLTTAPGIFFFTTESVCLHFLDCPFDSDSLWQTHV